MAEREGNMKWIDKVISRIVKASKKKKKKVKEKKKTAKQQNSKTARYRKIEKFIAFCVLPIGATIVMILPLLWQGLLFWAGILMDITILHAFYKAYLRDVPPVHVGMPVSPFWGRMEGEYLPEGKNLVVPWDKIELESIKVQCVTIEEEKGYYTLGAPIRLNADIFYSIDANNIYRYQEVKDEAKNAIDGKTREYLYGLIGSLDTDEAVVRQGEIRSGILEELRLHPIGSKEKLSSMLKIRIESLTKQLGSAKETTDKDKIDVEKIKDLNYKMDLTESRRKLVKIELKSLYQQEWRKEIKNKKDKGVPEDDNEIKILRKAIETLEGGEEENSDIVALKVRTRTHIKERETEEQSELEEQFAIRILGSRVYGFDIADKDTKDARSKRTTAKFARDVALTEWDATNLSMSLLKQKYPELTDAELLKAMLIKEDKIIEKINIFGIEGLQKMLPQVVNLAGLFLKKSKDENKEVSDNVRR